MPAVLFTFLENFVLAAVGMWRLLHISEILAFRLRIRGQPFLNATYILAPGESLIVPNAFLQPQVHFTWKSCRVVNSCVGSGKTGTMGSGGGGRNVGSSQQVTLGHSDSYLWFMGFLDFSQRKTEHNV